MNNQLVSEVIGGIDLKYISEAAEYAQSSHIIHKKILRRFGTLAACLAIALIVGFGVFSNNSDDTHCSSVNNDTLNFVKNNGGGNIQLSDIAAQIRALTADETDMLFNNLQDAEAFGLFDPDEDHLIGVEGTIGSAKVIISAPNHNVLDTVIGAMKQTDEIYGVPISAGYFVTKANSAGKKTAVYYASFELDGYTVYIENSGNADESDSIRKDISDIVKAVIDNGTPDLNRITK